MGHLAQQANYCRKLSLHSQGAHSVIPDNGGDKEMMIQYLQKYITDQQADLGIAIDAQSDRLMLV